MRSDWKSTTSNRWLGTSSEDWKRSGRVEHAGGEICAGCAGVSKLRLLLTPEASKAVEKIWDVRAGETENEREGMRMWEAE